MTTRPARARYRVIGMDCAHDAAEIEAATRAVPGVQEARVSVASQVLTVLMSEPAIEAEVRGAVAAAGYGLGPLADEGGEDDVGSTPSPAYRRALRLVVGLNLGFGVAELAGGLLSGSQALQADALDFLGDGLITLLALVALGWRAVARARTALAQGVFLAVLGVGVLGSTAYRVFVRAPPDADVMGVLGLLALVVNVAAALLLLPHRTGDTNARAVWLFSRNDALGNAAVVAAAVLVALTGTPWPDLVVAVAIAGLFLHSAIVIIRDARADLREETRAMS